MAVWQNCYLCDKVIGALAAPQQAGIDVPHPPNASQTSHLSCHTCASIKHTCTRRSCSIVVWYSFPRRYSLSSRASLGTYISTILPSESLLSSVHDTYWAPRAKVPTVIESNGPNHDHFEECHNPPWFAYILNDLWGRNSCTCITCMSYGLRNSIYLPVHPRYFV